MLDPADLERARAYPYYIPPRSYVLSQSGFRELQQGDPCPDLTGRQPVIASGSNQSPPQLARKFNATHFGSGDDAPIPVLQTRISNFDSVFSPHFSGYGSIAATLHYSPGVTADVFTTWLNETQLQRMHETEALGLNYDFGRLDKVHLEIDGLDHRDSVFAYIGRRGALSLDGQPVALGDVSARGRKWPAMTQNQVQELARDRLSPGLGLDRFISENIERVDIRHDRTVRLAIDAIPFSYDHLKRL